MKDMEPLRFILSLSEPIGLAGSSTTEKSPLAFSFATIATTPRVSGRTTYSLEHTKTMCGTCEARVGRRLSPAKGLECTNSQPVRFGECETFRKLDRSVNVALPRCSGLVNSTCRSSLGTKRGERSESIPSTPNPGNPHRLPGLFSQYPHGESRHTVAETSGASLRGSLRLAAREDKRLPAERKAKVQSLRALTFSLSFSLSGDNSGLSNFEASRAMPRVFLGGSLCFCSFIPFYGRVARALAVAIRARRRVLSRYSPAGLIPSQHRAAGSTPAASTFSA